MVVCLLCGPHPSKPVVVHLCLIKLNRTPMPHPVLAWNPSISKLILNGHLCPTNFGPPLEPKTPPSTAPDRKTKKNKQKNGRFRASARQLPPADALRNRFAGSTGTGRRRGSTVPSPSCPKSLPQKRKPSPNSLSLARGKVQTTCLCAVSVLNDAYPKGSPRQVAV